MPDVGMVTRALGIVNVGAASYPTPTLVIVMAVTAPPDIVAVPAAVVPGTVVMVVDPTVCESTVYVPLPPNAPATSVLVS